MLDPQDLQLRKRISFPVVNNCSPWLRAGKHSGRGTRQQWRAIRNWRKQRPKEKISTNKDGGDIGGGKVCRLVATRGHQERLNKCRFKNWTVRGASMLWKDGCIPAWFVKFELVRSAEPPIISGNSKTRCPSTFSHMPWPEDKTWSTTKEESEGDNDSDTLR